MAKFVVESSHTEEECAKAIEESIEMGNLEKFVFGCKSGEHTGWAYIDAKNQEEALKMVPEFIRDDACAYEVGKFTQEELKAAHQ